MDLRPKRVIVVDHRRTVADTLVEVLKLNGYDAIALYSGEEAVTLALTYRPYAVLLDVMLPGLNGVDAAQLIVAQLPGCRIILMSGHPETAELLRAANPRDMPLEVLPKPIHPHVILNALAGRSSPAAPIESTPESPPDIGPLPD